MPCDEQDCHGEIGGAVMQSRLQSFVEAWSNTIIGYTIEEIGRLDDFRERNPDRPVIAPLIDVGLSKDDCKAMILRAGIALPVMYLMGYDNNNCIGCVKGGVGTRERRVISAIPFVKHGGEK